MLCIEKHPQFTIALTHFCGPPCAKRESTASLCACKQKIHHSSRGFVPSRLAGNSRPCASQHTGFPQTRHVKSASSAQNAQGVMAVSLLSQSGEFLSDGEYHIPKPRGE